MYTRQQLQLLRNSAPGSILPGVDTQTGVLLPQSSFTTLGSIPTAWNPSGIYMNTATNTVYVMNSGTVVNGYDFGNATVYVIGANVTIKNCKFTSTSGWYAIQASSTAQNLTITNNTFDGGGKSLKLGAWISTTSTTATITNNTFLRTPSDGIDMMGGGVISGNYFSGGGYTSNQSHPDAIWVTNSTNPLTISNNFIDWTTNPDSTYYTNDCIRITGELGPVSNVTVTGNYLLGGSSSIQAIQIAGQSALTNVSITNNYMGCANFYGFYPGSSAGIVETGNVVYDWTNPIFSTNAWTAYQAAGLPTPYLLASVNGASVNPASSPGPTTVYGGGTKGTLLYGGTRETNFVGGFGYQNFWLSTGANVFTYLSIGDSTPNGQDTITNFDPAKDVFDFSRVATNAASQLNMAEKLTFIGTAAFDGAGAEVRYQQNANGTTTIQLALAGDTAADMQISINGHYDLTAANFALTADQSKSAMSAGAALQASTASGSSWPLVETLYSGVQGRAYSSYASIQSGSLIVLDDLNFSATSGEIDLFGAPGQPATAVTITKGGGQESVTSQGKTVSLTFHQNETIQAGNANAPETFAFSSGWGNETINGFVTSGANADTLQLSASAFSYLNPATMTQNQELAAVLLNATSGVNGTTIVDSRGDTLTLAGISVAALNANPGLVKFV